MDSKAESSLYVAGRLEEAIAACLITVKGHPSDIGARLFLSELLCFQGDWERAEKQLDAVTRQSHDDGLLALLMRQLIRGEILREQVFMEGRSPQLVGELPPDAKLQLELCIALRDQQKAESIALVESAQGARVPVSGLCDGIAFDDIRDLDDRMAGILEVITATGKYYWVPWAAVKELVFSKPERPVDLIWRKASIDVDNGPEGEVFIPVRYPCPKSEGWDDQLRLGRASSWAGDEPGAVLGLGQRMVMIGEDAKGWMEINSISIPRST
jgi:type VI secretion system protein ImpE